VLVFLLRAVYSIAHRVTCIADAAEQRPGGVDASAQLRALRAEARQLLAEASHDTSSSAGS
jgi:hypothetical protein